MYIFINLERNLYFYDIVKCTYIRIQNANLPTTYSRYSVYVLTVLINEIPLHFRIIRINKAAQE